MIIQQGNFSPKSVIGDSAPKREFSLKMRKVNLKYARVKKYKLKTKKAFQKRFRIVIFFVTFHSYI